MKFPSFKHNIGDGLYEVQVTYAEPLIPAVTNALPEFCYPAEGGELEFDVIGFEGTLTDAEYLEISNKCWELLLIDG